MNSRPHHSRRHAVVRQSDQPQVRAGQRACRAKGPSGKHGCEVATSYVQHVAEWVGHIAAAEEGEWEYALTRLAGGIATIDSSREGALRRRHDPDNRQRRLARSDGRGSGASELHTRISLLWALVLGRAQVLVDRCFRAHAFARS